MSSFTKGRLSWRARSFVSLVSVSTIAVAFALTAPLANADAGNPILSTIHGSIAKTPMPGFPDAVTVYVRGQWNWLSHTSDCNFDRAATGVGMIWNDKNEPGYTVAKGSISAGVGVAQQLNGDTLNTIDRMAHPVDRGNQVEGYTVSGTDYPTGQQYVDPSPPDPNKYLSWKGGCGREPLTATASKNAPGGGPNGEATGKSCADGTLACKSHPWGSWGYEQNAGLGYAHTYVKRSDVTTVCANFYDVHGGGTGTKFQLVNGAKEITVDGNGDNSIQTNAFNATQGANCISFPFIDHTTAVTNVKVGGNISDTATIAGAGATQVTYTQFHVFLPSDPNCTGADQYTGGRKSRTGNGDVTSDNVVANQAGDWHWTAELFDAATGGNLLDATKCGDKGETSTVLKAQPKIVTSASGPVQIGGSIHDTATLSDGFNPTGTITFTAFAPNSDGSADTTCSTLVFTSQPITVNGNGDYGSGDFTPSGVAPEIAGTYEWIASYGGDGNNFGAATKCGDTGEQSLVTKSPNDEKSKQNLLPNDQCTVTGFNPTGSCKFELFASTDCTGATIFSETDTLDANAQAETTNTTFFVGAGTYSWRITYDGDANNQGTTNCVEDFQISDI
jgi:hypothetical protein